MADLAIWQYLLIALLFVWGGFVRSGLGFGGAVLTLPFLLLILDQPLVFLPLIGVHLLIFSSLTVWQSHRSDHTATTVNWSFVRWALVVMAIPKAIGVLGVITLPGELISGFIFAIAHIRGGAEMGREWYYDGRQLNKMNTFTDFIDVSKVLIDEGYTSPEHLYARGGSAGGLLMGAVVNMAPELYNGISTRVPFVDVVTTMLDASIPLTASEWDEWGDPREKEFYDYMLSYSPYDQVTAQDYPNILVTTGLHDSQVQYWEPAKWVAKLRANKTDDKLLLLKTDMAAGHSGKTGRFQRLEDAALYYAFFLSLEGINE